MRASTWIVACAAAALAGCAGGGREAPERINAILSADAVMYGSFDADDDLQVTLAELEAGVTREFARADANSDGSLSPIEYQNWSNVALGGGQLPPYRLDFDRNVDNIITAEEFRNEVLGRARTYDTNEDSVLVRMEFVRQLNQARRPAEQPRQPRMAPPDRQ
jgi:hypothetical protein